MSYSTRARGIAKGSLWESPYGALARVIAASSGFVVVVPLPTATQHRQALTLQECAFRATFAPLYDRAKVRSQFTMSLANLGEFLVYWVPSMRRILARSISCSRQFRVPEEALLVGAYAAPCSVREFLDDLDELIQRQHREVSRPHAAVAVVGG